MDTIACPKCGFASAQKYCAECGHKLNENHNISEIFTATYESYWTLIKTVPLIFVPSKLAMKILNEELSLKAGLQFFGSCFGLMMLALGWAKLTGERIAVFSTPGYVTIQTIVTLVTFAAAHQLLSRDSHQVTIGKPLTVQFFYNGLGFLLLSALICVVKLTALQELSSISPLIAIIIFILDAICLQYIYYTQRSGCSTFIILFIATMAIPQLFMFLLLGVFVGVRELLT